MALRIWNRLRPISPHSHAASLSPRTSGIRIGNSRASVYEAICSRFNGALSVALYDPEKGIYPGNKPEEVVT